MTIRTTPSSAGRRRVVAAAGLSFLLLASACGDSTDGPTTTAAGTGALAPAVPLRVDGNRSAGNGAEAASLSADVAGAADMSMIAPWYIADYVVEGTLPSMPGEANGWQFVPGAAATEDAIRQIAAALGVTGEPVAVPAEEGGGWRIGPTDGSAPMVQVSTDGQLSWWYSGVFADGDLTRCVMVDPVETELEPVDDLVDEAVAEEAEAVATDGTAGEAAEPPPAEEPPAEPMPVDECAEPEPPAGILSAAEAEARAADLLEAMGVPAGSVQFETYADEWYASVTAWVVLNGTKSPIAYGFGFGAEGRLEWANGMLADLAEAGPYPLVSVEDAIARLKDGYGGFGGAVPLADTAMPDFVECEGGPAVDCMPVEPEPVTVTIVDVKMDLWWLWTVDGSSWLVPAFSFIDSDGGIHTVPAVTDDYLMFDEPTVGTDEPGSTDPSDGTVVDGEEPVGSDGEPGVSEPGDPGDGDVVEPDPGTDPGDGGFVEPEALTDEQVAVLVGLTEAEATTLAEGEGWTVRVVARDGESFPVTEDYQYTRVNLTITDGLVESVTVG